MILHQPIDLFHQKILGTILTNWFLNSLYALSDPVKLAQILEELLICAFSSSIVVFRPKNSNDYQIQVRPSFEIPILREP